MVVIRLLKSRAGDFSQILDSAEIPDLDDNTEIQSIVVPLGKMLKPYQEGMKDPNLVDSLTKENTKTWTVTDITSLKYELARQGFDLLITSEPNGNSELKAGQVKFLLVDNSVKSMGFIPYGDSRIVPIKDAVDNLAVIGVIKSLLANIPLFDKSKFNINPVNDLLTQLENSRKVLGTVNPAAMNKLSTALSILEKKVYAFSLA